MLPEHGKIHCRQCFIAQQSKITKLHPDWRMINDPGAWGGSRPEYLVLGFSKGATQQGIFESGKFEDVAFSGMRVRLTQALRSVGALGRQDEVSDKIANPSGNIAFGSLIRCSVSRKDQRATLQKGDDVFSCTGPMINKSFREIPQVINTCANKFLRDLPLTIKAVFFLGNGDAYVKQCQTLLKNLFPDTYQQINSMAAQADGHIWIHLAHPSGLNGHFNTWLLRNEGPGKKRLLAIEALNHKQILRPSIK